MTEHSILITGSNRGIGLELVRRYAADGWKVHACCREPARAEALAEVAAHHSSVMVHTLEVTSRDSIAALAHELRNETIDILFNNAGIYGQDDAGFGNTDEGLWLEAFRVNTIAPMKMMEAFVDQVANSRMRIIATMSSKMGSMADNGSGGSYVYRSSKAAVNAVMKSAAIDLGSRGIRVAILHPGWVRTDMGGPHAEITTEESVRGMRAILARMDEHATGTFFDIDGSVIPW